MGKQREINIYVKPGRKERKGVLRHYIIFFLCFFSIFFLSFSFVHSSSCGFMSVILNYWLGTDWSGRVGGVFLNTCFLQRSKILSYIKSN